jgi:hypothetical protein
MTEEKVKLIEIIDMNSPLSIHKQYITTKNEKQAEKVHFEFPDEENENDFLNKIERKIKQSILNYYFNYIPLY